MQTTFLKILSLLTMLGLLSACSPGMQMSEKPRYSGVFSAQVDTGDPILITHGLVAQMNASEVNNPIYTVGEQDVLMIKVWGDDDLSVGTYSNAANTGAGGLVVQSNGSIFYPYIGNVRVSGKSIEQIRILLTEKLSEYIAEPQISVGVSEYRSKRVHIMGEVKRPGSYPITDTPMSILDAAMLGEINNRSADTEQIFVIRRATESDDMVSEAIVYQFNGKSADAMLLAGQFYLQANDVVFIAPAEVVSWNRVISNILPSIGLGAQISALGN